MIQMRFTIKRQAVIEAGLPLDAIENLMEDLRGMGEPVGDFLKGDDVAVTLQVEGDLWDACEHWMGTLAELQTYIRPQQMPDRPAIVVLP